MLTTIILIGIIIAVFFIVRRRKDSLFKGVVPTTPRNFTGGSGSSNREITEDNNNIGDLDNKI
jgi:hypothetical protein